MALNSKQQAFVVEVYTSAKELGLPDHIAKLAAAQAALETGYGQKGENAKSHNYFGMKAGDGWTGKTATRTTKEEVRGELVDRNEKFRVYDDPRQSLMDWADKMRTSWPGVLESKTFEEAVAALNSGNKGKYATDSSYGTKLSAVGNTVDRAIADTNGIGQAGNFGFGGTGGIVAPHSVAAFDPGDLGVIANESWREGLSKQNEKMIGSLHPDFRERAASFINEGNRRGLDLMIPDEGGFRTFAEQKALNKPGAIAASPGNSRHNYGIAFDAVPRSVLGTENWSPESPLWDDLAALRQEYNLAPGPVGDLPHTQVDMSKRDMKSAAFVNGYPDYAPGLRLAIMDDFVPTPTFRPDFTVPEVAPPAISFRPDSSFGPAMPWDNPPPLAPETFSVSLPEFAPPPTSRSFAMSMPDLPEFAPVPESRPFGGPAGVFVGGERFGTALANVGPEEVRSGDMFGDMRSNIVGRSWTDNAHTPNPAAAGVFAGGERFAPMASLTPGPTPINPTPGQPNWSLPSVAPVPTPRPEHFAALPDFAPVPMQRPEITAAIPGPQYSREARPRDIARGALKGAPLGLPGMIAGGVRTARNGLNPGPFASRGLMDRIGALFSFDGPSLAPADIGGIPGLFGGSSIAPSWSAPTAQGEGPTANWDRVEGKGGGFFSNWF